jgi:hypothetical protein
MTAFDDLADLIYDIIGDSRKFTIAILVLALVIAGILLAIAGDQGKEKAKMKIVWVFVGAIVITVGRNLVTELFDKMTDDTATATRNIYLMVRYKFIP